MSESKILESLQNVNNEIGAIAKDQKGYGYMFRGITQVMNVIGPLFKKYNILVTRKILSCEKSFYEFKNTKGQEKRNNMVLLTMEYTFISTIDGSTFITNGIGEGEDTTDKAVGMAISNSYKYVIFEMFNIPTADQIDSDQKTALDNKLEGSPLEKETSSESEVKKEGGFKRKKVKQPVVPSEEGEDNDF